MGDHQITVEELCSKYETDPDVGLTRANADARLARDGKNLVYPQRSRRRNFLWFMLSEAPLILAMMSLLCLAIILVKHLKYHRTDPIDLILCIVLGISSLFIGVVSFLQGRHKKTEDAVPVFKNEKVEVIRDGKKFEIPAEDIVVGDLVRLKVGDRVPADVRIIESCNFKVDNFYLTGVHDPQQLTEKLMEPNPVESPNVAYCSSGAVDGSARGIVIRTGTKTLIAGIFDMKQSTRSKDPITRQILDFLNLCALWAIVLALIFLIVFLVTAEAWRYTTGCLMTAVVVNSLVPKDLMLSTIVSYHILSRKLSGKNCYVNSIRALQTLPFLSTICLVKPGVLTQKKVSVTNLWFDKKTVEVWGGSKIIWKEKKSSTFSDLARCAVLCNEATFTKDQQDTPINMRKISGNVYDTTILRFLTNLMGKKVDRLREAHPKVFWIPYNSTNKFHLSIHKMNESLLMILAGEPDILVRKCTTFLIDGTDTPIDDSFLEVIDKACIQFSRMGETMKCIIDQIIPREHGDWDFYGFQIPETGFRFVGMITLFDPPLPEIPQTVQECRNAGIKVLLLTNDHPIEARSFARQIGVISDNSQTLEESAESKNDSEDRPAQINAVVIDGMQLRKLTVRDIESLLAAYPEIVFARLSPIQRLMLIEAYQKNNSVVAVVGDIFEDRLAMKKADLGVTLVGNEESPSQETADIFLTNKNFYSLVACVEESRAIYENVKKSTAFILTSSTAISLALFVYCVLGIPLPISPFAVIVHECLSDIFPAMALMFERTDSNVMQRSPQKLSKDRFWSHQMIFYACAQLGVIEFIAGIFTYFAIMEHYGWSPIALIGIREYWDSEIVNNLEDSYGQEWSYVSRKNLEILCQTGYFFALVLMQCGNALVCRTQRISVLKIKNRSKLIYFGILFEMTTAFIVTYTPLAVDIFGHILPLHPIWWLLPVPYLLFLILYDELRKFLVKKSPKGWLDRETTY